MANSPVVLDGFLQLKGALVRVVLSEAFQEQIPSAFLRLVTAIIVWPLILQSVKELDLHKKKPFQAKKGYLPIPKLRQVKVLKR